jgi:hypothetical protein
MKKSLLSPAVSMRARNSDTEDDLPSASEAASPPVAKARAGTRVGLKHFGAYLDDDTVEKVAVLRARLKLDNSQLVKLAIEELFASKRAESAFRR